jgi:hypothetical protein
MLQITFCLALGLGVHSAPNSLQNEPGGGDGIRFGRSLLVLEDLDGDGHPEIAVGAPVAASTFSQGGLVLVLSGADRKVVQEWHGEQGREHFGHTLRDAGDVDGDGKADVLVGYEFGGRTEVRSGVDGSFLVAFDRSEKEVLPLGDADRDGSSDFLLVVDQMLEVRSGRDGGLLAGKLFIYEQGSIYSTGDVDGDGLSDVIVAAEKPVLWQSGRDANASLEDSRLFNPDKRVPLDQLWREQMGREKLKIVNVAPAGDLDGDRAQDILLAIQWEGDGAVLGLSLSKSAPVFEVLGRAGLGYVMRRADDLNGDGVPDVLIGENPGMFSVSLWAHSGSDGEQLWGSSWGDGGATAGLSLGVIPPRDPGEKPLVLVGSSDWMWHGVVVRNGRLRAVTADSGELTWSLDVDEVHRPGAGTGDDSVYR